MSSSQIYRFEALSLLFEGENLTVEGQIMGDIMKNGQVSTYSIHVKSITMGSKTYSGNYKIKVVDYKNNKSYIVPFNNISIAGEFNNGKRYNNSGSPDFEKLLFKDGICGILTADYSSSLKSYKTSDRFISRIIFNFRNMLGIIMEKYTDRLSAGILKGLLFGDVSGISKDNYDAFEKSGIIHIFAVSGYNIWLLSYILSLVLYRLKKHNKLRTIIIICIIGFYTIVSGCTPSVLRAFIMASTVLLGRILKKQPDQLTSLSFAALLILIYNPLQILDIGFQLSFISAASMILLFPIFRNISFGGRIKDGIMLTLAVQAGISPIILYNFNSFPVFSVISNILIAPLISTVTIMGIMLLIIQIFSSSAALLMGYAIGYVINLVIVITAFISSIPYSNLNAVSPGLIGMILYYAAIMIFFKLVTLKTKYERIVRYIIFLYLIFCMVKGMIPGEMRISFLDVGQGDCMLVTTPDKKYILIDGGGKTQSAYSNIDIGEDVLKPYLYKHGINRLDLIISTHCHDDHLNGLIPVMTSMDFDKLVKRSIVLQEDYKSLWQNISINSDKVIGVQAGDVLDVGKHVKLFILSPDGMEDNENDSSLVFKLQYREFAVLFTGDIGSDVFDKLMAYDIESDVLKVPHHGSAGSMGAEFLKKVNPKAAVICVGKNNFGHPARQVISNILESSISLYRTDKNGEIIIFTEGKGFRVETIM